MQSPKAVEEEGAVRLQPGKGDCRRCRIPLVDTPQSKPPNQPQASLRGEFQDEQPGKQGNPLKRPATQRTRKIQATNPKKNPTSNQGRHEGEQ